MTEVNDSQEKRLDLFKNKSSLETLTTPQGAKLIGREKELALLTGYLSPSYNNWLVVPFISVYGKSGTGKSAAVELVCKDLERQGLLTFRFVNLRKARTVFGCANTILHALGGSPLKSADGMNIALENIERAIDEIMAKTGLDKNQASDGNSSKKLLFVLVLDEFDVLFHHRRRDDPSDFIFSLILIEEQLRRKGNLMCIVGISNNVVTDNSTLDDRVRSRIGSSEIYFPPYKMKELIEILQDRQALAFSHPVKPDVLEFCAKLSSRHHGDARRAIDLLRRAAEVASLRHEAKDRTADSIVTIEKQDVEMAFAESQRDSITDIVRSLPKQLYYVVAALVRLGYLTDGEWHSTSILLEQYEDYGIGRTGEDGLKPLSRRRFSEALAELENIGLVESRRTSAGRYGYHAMYRLAEDPKLFGETCYGGEWWDNIVNLKERRIDFLTGKSFGKVWSEFEKRKKENPGYDESLGSEMNDHNWEILVYGRPIVRINSRK